MDRIDPRENMRMGVARDAATDSCGLEWVTHHDIGGGKGFAGKPGTLGEFGLDVAHLYVDHGLEFLLGDTAEEWDAAQDQVGEQHGHQGAFGVVEEMAVAE